MKRFPSLFPRRSRSPQFINTYTSETRIKSPLRSGRVLGFLSRGELGGDADTAVGTGSDVWLSVMMEPQKSKKNEQCYQKAVLLALPCTLVLQTTSSQLVEDYRIVSGRVMTRIHGDDGDERSMDEEEEWTNHGSSLSTKVKSPFFFVIT